MSRENQKKNMTITDYSSFKHWGYKKSDIIAINNLKKRDEKIERQIKKRGTYKNRVKRKSRLKFHSN